MQELYKGTTYDDQDICRHSASMQMRRPALHTTISLSMSNVVPLPVPWCRNYKLIHKCNKLIAPCLEVEGLLHVAGPLLEVELRRPFGDRPARSLGGSGAAVFVVLMTYPPIVSHTSYAERIVRVFGFIRCELDVLGPAGPEDTGT